MALTHPLLHASPVDITLERVRALVRQTGPESSVVEYKEKFTDTIAKGVAALANTYGGLMLIGVTDARIVKGVKEKTIESVAEHCNSKIEPPYVPEIIPVPMGQGSDLYVLVLRVVPGTHRLPLLVDGVAWVRSQNTCHPADWARLRDLFAVGTLEQAPEGAWNIVAPEPSVGMDGMPDSSIDLIMRTGITVPVSTPATWRPLSEATVATYIAALNQSPLADRLNDLAIAGGSGASIGRFRHKGHNRARDIRLEWWGAPTGWPSPVSPVVSRAHLEVPGAYGVFRSRLLAEVDVILRFSAAAESQAPASAWRVTPHQLGELVDAMLATATSTEVIDPIAQMAGVDPSAVPQPRALHIRTTRPITDVLDTDGLDPIPDAGSSHGAHLLADPARDLSATIDRRAQVKDWLIQVALDSGLRGMQRLLEANP